MGDITQDLNLRCENEAPHGMLKVKCSFSFDKDLQIVVKEYRRLFRILLLYELKRSEVRTLFVINKENNIKF